MKSEEKQGGVGGVPVGGGGRSGNSGEDFVGDFSLNAKIEQGTSVLQSVAMHEQTATIARIQKDLVEMKRKDDEMRKNEPDEWDAVVEGNTKKLQDIVDEIGWPTISLVGREAAKYASDIVQHVTPNSAFHARCLRLMKACPAGDVEQSWIAHFEDRMRTNNGKPQLYGTEFRQNADGQFEPFPIEDAERLDARRRAMGMEDYEAFLRKLKEQGVAVVDP